MLDLGTQLQALRRDLGTLVLATRDLGTLALATRRRLARRHLVPLDARLAPRGGPHTRASLSRVAASAAASARPSSCESCVRVAARRRCSGSVWEIPW